MTDARRRFLGKVVDVATVLAAVLFVASYFPPRLSLSTTTATGGDMGAHFYPAVYMRDVLLPRGQVIGWCPGTYGGYPLFQFYFPLTFVLMSALSIVIPLPIAFKIVSQLGTLSLPVVSYVALRLMRVPRPGPALAAIGSLCFLFMEANSVWGGNIPSTLAGEFSFSLALSLSVLFLGMLYRTVETGIGSLRNAAIVSLVVLSHGYALLWAGLTSLLELFSTRAWWHRLRILVTVHGLAILLTGFFLVQLLVYARWTTAFSHAWLMRSWREILPPILWPASIASLSTTAILLFWAFRRHYPFPRALATLWGSTLVALLLWLTAPYFHVVDIRFLPFLQISLCLTAAVGLGHLLARLPAPEVWPLIALLAALPFIQSRVTFIPSWIEWNYSGFETKPGWPAFDALNHHLRGDFRDARVVYEHSSAHHAIGTVRAFENLPLFSGRSTLEGLYLQGSPTAPFVFFVQSEISKEMSCPFLEYGCSRLDLDRGVPHLQMLNVSHYVVRSEEAKTAADRHPTLAKENTFGPLAVYRVRDNVDRYAIPLTLAPVLVQTDNWKTDAYRWFKRAGPNDPTPVFVEQPPRQDLTRFGGVVQGNTALPKVVLPLPPSLQEELGTDRITIKGCRPGHPVLVRISYHPRWRSLTGEQIWLAGPSFMLVFPNGERLDLVFGKGPWVRLGHALTVLGMLIFGMLFFRPTRRFAGETAAQLLVMLPGLRRLLQKTEMWSQETRTRLLTAVVAALTILIVVSLVAFRSPSFETSYLDGQRLLDAGKLEEALPLFQRTQQKAPLSSLSFHANYYEGIIHFRRENWAQAEQVFDRLLATFPEAPNAPESRYHLGICRFKRGDVSGARAAWEETIRLYPEADWSRYSRERLSEIP